MTTDDAMNVMVTTADLNSKTLGGRGGGEGLDKDAGNCVRVLSRPRRVGALPQQVWLHCFPSDRKSVV